MTPPCEFLPWDTAFFGHRIGRISGDRLTEQDMGPVMDWVREEKIRCLYFLCAPDHDESVRVAELLGFHLVDVRMDFLRNVPADSSGVESVRPFEPGDVEKIIAIAADAYRLSRFYFDPNFPEERASALYREWARKSCDGWADAVWVAPVKDGVGGFASCHLDTPSRGRIGLVGVRAGLRGAGIGPLVVGAALSYFAGKGVVEALVTTQARNLEAQRLYQKCGFRTHRVAYWYHRWFSGEGGR